MTLTTGMRVTHPSPYSSCNSARGYTEVDHGGSVGSTSPCTGEGLPGGNKVLTPVRDGHTSRLPFYGVYCTDGAKGGPLRGRSIALHECGDDMQSMPPFHYSKHVGFY